MPETVLADSRFDQQYITTHVLTDQRTYMRFYTTCWCQGRHPIQPKRPGGMPGWRVAGAWPPAALTRVTTLETATTTWRARRRAWLASRRRVASSCPGGSTAPRLASSGSALASSPAAGALHAVHLRLIHNGSAVAARTWPQAVPAVLRGCQQRCNRAFVTSPHLVTNALAAAHASKAYARSLGGQTLFESRRGRTLRQSRCRRRTRAAASSGRPQPLPSRCAGSAAHAAAAAALRTPCLSGGADTSVYSFPSTINQNFVCVDAVGCNEGG